jgi:hypothetical protein
MRAFLLIIWLPLLGCDQGPRVGSLITQKEVFDVTGTNKLVLVYVIANKELLGSGVGYNFYSLVWKSKEGTNWADQYFISHVAFQGISTRRRWVNDIEWLDVTNGTAIIKVGEESPPLTKGASTTINVVYSWREWSILTNGEVRTLRVCKDPFEKY